MDYSRIPEELKNQNQWVCAWDGSKVPMRAFERKAASSTAPDTWSTFEQAEWAVENGHYDHIGYVFADQNIVGIDIDAGFEDGLMTPLCADIMQACHSYTEKSRSGRVKCVKCASGRTVKDTDKEVKRAIMLRDKQKEVRKNGR